MSNYSIPDHFDDDQQGFYYQQLRQILKGKIDLPITDDHEQALRAEIRSRLSNEELVRWEEI